MLLFDGFSALEKHKRALDIFSIDDKKFNLILGLDWIALSINITATKLLRILVVLFELLIITPPFTNILFVEYVLLF